MHVAGMYALHSACALCVLQQNASHDFTSQQGCQAQQPLQPHLLLQGCHTQDDLVEALQVAQAYPDPTLRAQLVKELKQKQYKVCT